MSDANFPEWQIELDASKLKFPLEYKFILYNKQEKKADCWEKNPNRYLADPELKTNETLSNLRPICLFRYSCMERSRYGYTRIFLKIRKELRSRGFR